MKELKVTPRNGLPAHSLYDGSMETMEELDSLYEICHEELVSDKDAHQEWKRLHTRYKNPVGLFGRYLIPKIRGVARRKGFSRVDSLYSASLVAKKIAHNWKEN